MSWQQNGQVGFGSNSNPPQSYASYNVVSSSGGTAPGPAPTNFTQQSAPPQFAQNNVIPSFNPSLPGNNQFQPAMNPQQSNQPTPNQPVMQWQGQQNFAVRQNLASQINNNQGQPQQQFIPQQQWTQQPQAVNNMPNSSLPSQNWQPNPNFSQGQQQANNRPDSQQPFVPMQNNSAQSSQTASAGKASICPICEQSVPLHIWVEHANSHAAATRDRRDDDQARQPPTSHRDQHNIRDDQGQDDVRRGHADSTQKSVPRALLEKDYLILCDLLDKWAGQANVPDRFDCELCEARDLRFDALVSHTFKASHMRNLHMWMAAPGSIGNHRYKRYLPQPPPFNWMDFHFCEICLQLAGLKDGDVANHVCTAKHVTRSQNFRERFMHATRSSSSSRARSGPVPGPGADKSVGLTNVKDILDAIRSSNSSSSVNKQDFGGVTRSQEVREIYIYDNSQTPRRLPPEMRTDHRYDHPDQRRRSPDRDYREIQRQESSIGNGRRRSPDQPRERGKSTEQNYARGRQDRNKDGERERSGREPSWGISSQGRREEIQSSRGRKSPERKEVRRDKDDHSHNCRDDAKNHPGSSSGSDQLRKTNEKNKDQHEPLYTTPRPTSNDVSKKRTHESKSSSADVKASSRVDLYRSMTRRRRRLSPQNLSPMARNALTKNIETTWNAYYRKYFESAEHNPEIVLELQKEYLRSYKGFFKENPYFECYYVKLAKPEDLREALTLRIDRGSPGPMPIEEEKTKKPVLNSPEYKKVSNSDVQKASAMADKRFSGPQKVELSGQRKNSQLQRKLVSSSEDGKSDKANNKSSDENMINQRSSDRFGTKGEIRESRSPHRRTSPKGTSKPTKDVQPSKSCSDCTTSKSTMNTNRERHGKRSPDSSSHRIRAESKGISSSKARSPLGKQPHGDKKFDAGIRRRSRSPLSSRSGDRSRSHRRDEFSSSGRSRDRSWTPPIIYVDGMATRTRGNEKDQHTSSDFPKKTTGDSLDDEKRRIRDGFRDTKRRRSRSPLLRTDRDLSRRRSSRERATSGRKEPAAPGGMKSPLLSLPYESAPGRANVRDPYGFESVSRPSQQKAATDKNVPLSVGDILSISQQSGDLLNQGQTLALLEASAKGLMAASGDHVSLRTPVVIDYAAPGMKGMSENPQSVMDRLGLKVTDNPAQSDMSRGRRLPKQDSTGIRGRLGPQRERVDKLEVMQEPFLDFVHQTLTGMIIMSQVHAAMANDQNNRELQNTLASEKKAMQERMVTREGHMLIRMAAYCVHSPEDMERHFPEVNSRVATVLRNLDRDILELIAQTPIIDAHSLRQSI